MPLEPFKSSLPLMLGVELELQLVSLSDFDLTAASPDMLHLLNRASFPGNITPEITESMIEINTDIHTNHSELLGQLKRIRDTLVQAGHSERRNMRRRHPPIPEMDRAHDIFQAAVQGNICDLRLSRQAIHCVWPTYSCGLCIR